MTGDAEKSGWAVFKKIWVRLEKQQKLRLAALSILIFFSGLAEIISIGSIIPFMTVLLSPDKMDSLSIIIWLKSGLGEGSDQQIVYIMTAAFCTIVILAGILRVTSVWLITKISQSIGHNFEGKVYRAIIDMPYTTHMTRHGAEFISILEQAKLIGASVSYIVDGFNAIFINLCLVITLLFVNPTIAALCFSVLGGAFIAASLISRKRLTANSKKSFACKTDRMTTVHESLRGIRDIILDGGHKFYATSFNGLIKKLSDIAVENEICKQSPKIIIENMAIVFVALLACIIGSQGDITTLLPVFAAIALGVQKMLPLLQKIYMSWSFFKAESFSLDSALSCIARPDSNKETVQPAQNITFQKTYEMKNLNFRYAVDKPNVLKNINFKITAGQRIGIVGKTGSGKSTFLDIFMGLLPTTAGTIEVDGQALKPEQITGWQKNLAHVSQRIFIANRSIASNIALNISDAEIDHARIIEAARIAQAEEFINECPAGYDEIVGEQGIKLSGGQCQRLGIARAIYKQAPILILDEATSALDIPTESKVIEGIKNYSAGLTAIIVSHRMSILKFCDVIYLLEDGKLEQISYEELLKRNIEEEPPEAEAIAS
ncbi:MAG: ABC transporter ATP-binding protein [Alphaproteobacteria bacterium]|nr:ABC transporter ATP-binding protein [Alphaproteobacteria bacterium]